MSASAALLRQYDLADRYYQKAVRASGPLSEAAEAHYNSLALSHFLQLEKVSGDALGDSLRFRLYLKCGELYHYFDSLDLALRYYMEAIQMKRASFRLPDSLFFKAYLFAGHIYFYRNQLDLATWYFKAAEHIQETYPNRLAESERLFNDLGVIYFQGGNYYQAANYCNKAALVLPQTNSFYADFFVNYRMNYAIALFKLDQTDSAATILRALIRFRKHLNEIYNNLGLIEQRREHYWTALQMYRRVKYSNALQIGLENDKARAWLLLGRYDSANICVRRAAALHEKLNGVRSSIDHGLTLCLLGDLKFAQHDDDAALSYYQQALHQYYPDFIDNSRFGNPADFHGVFSYINLFQALVSKAAVLRHLWETKQQAEYGLEELNCYEAAFGLIEYVQNVYESDEARLFLQKNKYKIHDRPVAAALELYRVTGRIHFLQKAFELDQRSKASVLLFHDLQNRAIDPSSPLKKRELGLRQQITRLNLQAASHTVGNAMAGAGNLIRELEMQLAKVQDSISGLYPAVKVQVPDVRSLQTLLDSRTMLLSYHMGDSVMTVFIITRSAFTAVRKNIYVHFAADLKQTLTNLYSAYTSRSEAFPERLSKFLLDGVVSSAYTRLTVVPEGELDRLPFESLQHANHYLLEDFAIQYQYTTMLLRNEAISLRTAPTASFAPFAARSFDRGPFHFQKLEYSESEIAGLPGPVFKGAAATKSNFLRTIATAPVVHLATHAVAGDSTGKGSFIAFAPWNDSMAANYLLYVPEIYDLSLHNELIILSACETGAGSLVSGEGVMSISRAFAYAGCPNIVTSLWKADDQSTAFICHQMHTYLEKGFPIDVALQHAKIDFLSDKSVHPRKKLPAYWSHLVFIGNYRPFPATQSWIWIAGAALLTLALIVLWLRFQRTPAVKKGQ